MSLDLCNYIYKFGLYYSVIMYILTDKNLNFEARHAARAKELAAKFEAWEPEKQSMNNAINMLESEHASIESTKSLKARFESLQSEQPKEKARPKVNRFVVSIFMKYIIICNHSHIHVLLIKFFYEHVLIMAL